MGITLAKKDISRTDMLCFETAEVTLTLTGSTSITTNPVDIMLVLDCSRSMEGQPFADLKVAANSFVNIIANASNSHTPPPDSTAITNSQIGVVSFSTTATLALPLEQTVSTIHGVINGLSIDNLTNHAAAFTTATAALAGSTKPKFIIMMTDGESTAGGSGPISNVEAANIAAAAARAAGITIYCIGLGSANETNLKTWTADPGRVLMAPTSDQLQTAFESLAANIINAAPENISVVDTVNDEFEIISPITTNTPGGVIESHTVGADQRSITWTLDALGKTGPQTASLTFTIRYTGTTSGTFTVNKSITYDDATTPDPSKVKFVIQPTAINIHCDDMVNPDCDFDCITKQLPCCGDVVEIVAPSPTTAYEILCDGSILDLFIRFKNICPNRKLAVGAVVCEKVNGVEQPAIFRITTVTTPNHNSQPSSTSCNCQDFTVPLEILLPLHENQPSCTQREVKVRIIAHYISTSTIPCNKCSNPS